MRREIRPLLKSQIEKRNQTLSLRSRRDIETLSFRLKRHLVLEKRH